jgi:hypothetical protein
MERKVKLISMSDDKPLDSKHINLFKGLHEMRKKRRSYEFQEWLKKCNDDDVSNENFIIWFIDDIIKVLDHYKYEITNEKIFKDEIASFIYRLSKRDA